MLFLPLPLTLSNTEELTSHYFSPFFVFSNIKDMGRVSIERDYLRKEEIVADPLSASVRSSQMDSKIPIADIG